MSTANTARYQGEPELSKASRAERIERNINK